MEKYVTGLERRPANYEPLTPISLPLDRTG